jgi:hypothetical protein
MYKKKYKHLHYKIDIVKIIMKNTFILYVFDIIRLYIFNNMFDQTLSNLTLTTPKMQGKNGQRKYIDVLMVHALLGVPREYSIHIEYADI